MVLSTVRVRVRVRRRLAAAAVGLTVALVAGCATSTPSASPTSAAAPTTAAAPSSAPASAPRAPTAASARPAPSAAAAPRPAASAAVSPSVVPTPRVVAPSVGAGGTPVNIQVVGTSAEAAIYIATERGYFAQEGISPRFVTFDSAARAIPALSTGQIDVAAGVLSAGLFNAVNRGIDLRIVSPQSENTTCDHSSVWVTVRKDLLDSGAVKTAADLKGRKIAGPSKASTNEYILDMLLQKYHVAPTDVDYTELSFGDMGAAFASKAIDASVGAEPTITVYDQRGIAKKWICAADVIPNLQFTYLMYSGKFADQHSDLATKWMVAYLHGAHDWDAMLQTGQGKDQIFSYLSKYTPIKDRALFDKMNLVDLPDNGKIDVQNIQAQAQWAKDRGYLSQFPSSLSKVVDTRFADAAVKQLGY